MAKIKLLTLLGPESERYGTGRYGLKSVAIEESRVISQITHTTCTTIKNHLLWVCKVLMGHFRHLAENTVCKVHTISVGKCRQP